ncbi:MAG: hypothetical protein OXU79_19470 [Gemmatimonadota bacterium]|nr:hypothetical protein [Gemmatimonadota bacterium]
MIVADASPLIALVKLRRLNILEDLYGGVLIAPAVRAETIDAGRAIRDPGVAQLDAAVEDRWLKEVLLTDDERELALRLYGPSRLGRGEAESIAVADGRGMRLIVDDKEARSVSVAMSVEHIGTAGVFLEACMRRHLNLAELETVIRDLGQILWLSPTVVAEVLRLAREVER